MKCLRCGAGAEWIDDTRDKTPPAKLIAKLAATLAMERMDNHKHKRFVKGCGPCFFLRESKRITKDAFKEKP